MNNRFQVSRRGDLKVRNQISQLHRVQRTQPLPLPKGRENEKKPKCDEEDSQLSVIVIPNPIEEELVCWEGSRRRRCLGSWQRTLLQKSYNDRIWHCRFKDSIVPNLPTQNTCQTESLKTRMTRLLFKTTNYFLQDVAAFSVGIKYQRRAKSGSTKMVTKEEQILQDFLILVVQKKQRISDTLCLEKVDCRGNYIKRKSN